jgi:hypothetical protein
MPEPLATVIVGLLATYAAAGALFAPPFLTKGIAAIDPMARGSSWTFRLLVAPGVTVFWPLLLHRWARAVVSPPVEINAHRRRAAPARGVPGEVEGRRAGGAA